MSFTYISLSIVLSFRDHELDQHEKEKRPVKRRKDASPAPTERFLSPAAGPSTRGQSAKQSTPSHAAPKKKMSVVRGTSGKGGV